MKTITRNENAAKRLQDYINENNITADSLTVSLVKKILSDYMYYDVIDDVDKLNEELNLSESDELYKVGDCAIHITVEVPNDSYMKDYDGNKYYGYEFATVRVLEVHQQGGNTEYYLIDIC